MSFDVDRRHRRSSLSAHYNKPKDLKIVVNNDDHHQIDIDHHQQQNSLSSSSIIDETFCSNMLLETTAVCNNTNNNQITKTITKNSPIMKTDIDDEILINNDHADDSDNNSNCDHKIDNTLVIQQTTNNGPTINGCKKRKLYQPQQQRTTKMLNQSNGSIDTEDDDIDDMDDMDDDDNVDEELADEDEEANSNHQQQLGRRSRRSPSSSSGQIVGVEDILTTTATANNGTMEIELDDEGYDESGLQQEQLQQQQQLLLRQQQKQRSSQQHKSSESSNNVNINKELDLSNNCNNNQETQANVTSARISNNNIDNNQQSPQQPNNNNRHSNTKRARISDYERDLSKFQQQLLQKYTALQIFQQQQQQSKINHHSNGRLSSSSSSYPQRSSPPITMMNTMMSMNNNNNNNHSDCDVIQIVPDAATLFSQFGGHISPTASSHHAQQQQQLSSLSDKFCKIFDIDLFVETVTTQVIQSMARIVSNSIRTQLEAQQQQQQTPSQSQTQLKDNTKVGATDLLAQMLDAKYSSSSTRQTKLATTSPNGHHSKNGRDTADSPFVMANAFESSPISKSTSFVYPPNAVGGNFYAKQASGMYGRDTPVNLNGVRDTNSVSSSSAAAAASNVFGNRVVDATATVSPPIMAAEQTEAISLVVGPAKKRRNKVTDSRLPVRTPTRITRNVNNNNDEHHHLRETSSVSPPLLTNGGGSAIHFPSIAATTAANSLPVSLASLQHASEFFDQSTALNTTTTNATTFPFGGEQTARLAGSLFNIDEMDHLKNSLNGSATNGPSSTMNGSSTAATGHQGTDAVANAVAAAATAHHLRMFVASRASPDSMSGFPGGSAVLSSYGRGSGTGSENGGDGSETNDTQSIYDPSMPMISFSNKQFANYNRFSPNSDSLSLTSLHTSTLSPMHLRKAKLMFFYVRYPSSSILKMFFPDIKFNKNNTAQLVKWFSNFR